MTKPIKASEQGLKPHYKVRVAFPGSLVHLASWDEPHLKHATRADAPVSVEADWISDPEYGDTLGFIDWNAALAVTWRRTE